MLEQILTHLRNWFQVGIYPGEYCIKNGNITLPFLQDWQYFRVTGSLFNNGLHQYGPAMVHMKDEEFTGTIWALAIPHAVVELSEEIAKWQEKYGDAAANPYVSESFGGYTYMKSAGSSVNADSGNGGWQAAFRVRLNPYRKLREI